MNRPTCFKNPMSPSCIDLFLTSCPKSFESTLTIETSLSGFRKLIVTVLKFNHEKDYPKIIQYRDCKNFDSTRGWISSPAETFYFPRTIKGTKNGAVFTWVKKQQ